MMATAQAAYPLLARGNATTGFQTLKPAFETMVAALLASTRKLAATPFTFILGSIVEERAADHLAARQGRSVAALFDVAEPAGMIAVLVETPLVFALVEAVLGGDGLEQPFAAARPLSKIERSMARLIADHVSEALRSALDGTAPLQLDFDRLEADLEFVDLGRSDPTVLIVAVEIEAAGRKAALSILIPAALAALLGKSVVPSLPAEPNADPAWSKQLGSRVGRADVRIEAVFSEAEFTLADIASLKAGQTLRLKARQSSLLTLQCDERPLFRGRMGQSDGRYAIRIEEPAGDDLLLAGDLLP